MTATPPYPVVSAGGVVVRHTADRTELLVVERTKDIEPKWKPVLCQLPKGAISHGETLEETALREVLEETGYTAKIVAKAGTASWSYVRAGTQYEETVHYFLMSLQSAIPQEHDQEFEQVCWLEFPAAQNALSYPEERRLIHQIAHRANPPR